MFTEAFWDLSALGPSVAKGVVPEVQLLQWEGSYQLEEVEGDEALGRICDYTGMSSESGL